MLKKAVTILAIALGLFFVSLLLVGSFMREKKGDTSGFSVEKATSKNENEVFRKREEVYYGKNGSFQENSLEKFQSNDFTERGVSSDSSSSSSLQEENERVADSCFPEQFSYVLRRFNQGEICESYNGEICVKKVLNCSVEVQNLEVDKSGEFSVKFIALDKDKQNLTELSSIIKTHNLTFLEAKKFFVSFVFESSGESGDANKNLSCLSYSVSIPKKLVC